MVKSRSIFYCTFRHKNEFLSPKMFLHSLFIVRHCLKLNKSLKLTCVELDSLYRPFSRSADDDVICQTPPYYITTSLKPHQRVSDQELRLILELCNKKCDDLLAENHEKTRMVKKLSFLILRGLCAGTVDCLYTKTSLLQQI